MSSIWIPYPSILIKPHLLEIGRNPGLLLGTIFFPVAIMDRQFLQGKMDWWGALRKSPHLLESWWKPQACKAPASCERQAWCPSGYNQGQENGNHTCSRLGAQPYWKCRSLLHKHLRKYFWLHSLFSFSKFPWRSHKFLFQGKRSVWSLPLKSSPEIRHIFSGQLTYEIDCNRWHNQKAMPECN